MYSGIIKVDHGNKTYDVHFDDGDKELKLEAESIKDKLCQPCRAIYMSKAKAPPCKICGYRYNNANAKDCWNCNKKA